jgi:hypothetical protein
MKRIAIALALFAALALPAFAGEGHDHGAKATETTMTGWISDSNCGAKNANAEGAGCAKSCIKGGAKAVLVVGEKVYTINGDAKLYMDRAGQLLDVTGVVDGDTIKISKIGPAAKKA